MESDLLTDEQVDLLLAAHEAAGSEPPVEEPEAFTPATVDVTPPARYRFVRPMTQAADGLVETIANPEGRFMFGLPEIDSRIRGVGPGDLCLITGYSHSGKSQLFFNSVLHNRDKPVLLFTPDETSELVLMKLVCMLQRQSAEVLEQRIKDGDQHAIQQVHMAARRELRNLIVIDQSLTLSDMSLALQEAEAWWGQGAAAVGLDYLGLLRCDADDIEGKSEALKAWTKDHQVPMVCIHQAGRGAAGKGQPITMTSGKYGGEQEAIFMLGVYRKRDNPDLDEWDRAQNANTVSLQVVKNKRPPCKRTPDEGIDHFIDPECGLIRPIRPEDYPGVQSQAQRALREAGAARPW